MKRVLLGQNFCFQVEGILYLRMNEVKLKMGVRNLADHTE